MPSNRKRAPGGQESNTTRRHLLIVAAGAVLVGIGALDRPGGTGTVHAAEGSAPQSPARAASPLASTPPGGKPAKAAAPSATRLPAGRPSAAGGVVPGQPVSYVGAGQKVIALTVDDGPSPVYTPQVLRVLEKYGVRATFSMVGKNVSYYPAVARDVVQSGHTAINHTWNHANLTKLNKSQQLAQITRAAAAIHAATGVHPRMFRAPYGVWSRQALDYCAAEHLIALDWSVDPRDWSRPGVSEIVRTIMRTTKKGSIILEHDGGGDRSQTVAALKVAIPRLIDEGYQFVIP
jgi:peptidoglycan/xylan/chitin deacetylase (PgdA/CDA1 family)